MIAYVVTSGSYSEYAINCVFSTLEKAEAWVHSWGEHTDYDIETYEMDTEPLATPHIRVKMRKDGSLVETPEHNKRQDHGFEALSHGWPSVVEPYLVWSVETDDEMTAIKVVNEKRAQIIAMNLWDKNSECYKLFHQPKSQA